MNKNIVNEIGNYIQQIISSAESLEEEKDLAHSSKKIKNAAYKIDALISDVTKEIKSIDIQQGNIEGIDLALFSKLHILIIDDLVENIQIMENIFKTLSCNICSALSGEEALELYAKGFEPDIVCMDMMMPGMDGVTTTKELKRLGSKAYFIAITALKNQSSDIVSLFDCWLPKPFTLEQIKMALAGYKKFSYIEDISVSYKLQNTVSIEVQESILELIEEGAYTRLKTLIENLEDSESKRFLMEAILRVDFHTILDSLVDRVKVL